METTQIIDSINNLGLGITITEITPEERHKHKLSKELMYKKIQKDSPDSDGTTEYLTEAGLEEEARYLIMPKEETSISKVYDKEQYQKHLSDYNKYYALYEDSTDENEKMELDKKMKEAEIEMNKYEHKDDDNVEEKIIEEFPDELNDMFISDVSEGHNVSYAGEVLHTSKDYDDSIAFINKWMKDNKYYPTVWYVNERGTYWAIDENGDNIKTRFDEGGTVMGELEPQNVVNTFPYIPQSQSCDTLNTIVPEKMSFDMHKAVAEINKKVGGVDAYVAEKLGYINGVCNADEKKEGIKCLCDALAADQIDAVAVAIFNIETRRQGVIIGDFTGIGKGRCAAAIIKYAVNIGALPIFLTAQPDLFSDIYRDLIDIGADDGIPEQIYGGTKQEKRPSKELVETTEELENSTTDVAENDEDEESDYIEKPVYVKNKLYPSYKYKEKDDAGNDVYKERKGKNFITPFIVNSKDKAKKTVTIKDNDGNILYRYDEAAKKKIIGTAKAKGTFKIPKQYNAVLATYSQFGSPSVKSAFFSHITKGAIIIMDESHKASGESNTGAFLREAIKESLGCVFLSATFAKRPDNMPVYASKTSLQDSTLNDDELITAIEKGGVALQEVISSQLAKEGQMLRRERSFDGIEVNYMYMDETQTKRGFPNLNKESEHSVICDGVTNIIRDIIYFQQAHVDPVIEDMDDDVKEEMGEVKKERGQKQAGIDNTPAFNGIFNLINQLLFSIKAESAAEVAIQRMKEGKQVVIAFGNTMESFLNTLVMPNGEPARIGDKITSDFSIILEKRLNSTLRYKEVNASGEEEKKVLEISELSMAGQNEYARIKYEIKNMSSGIKNSPIDVLIHTIRKAGFTVEECTGRAKRIALIDNGEYGIIEAKPQQTITDIFRKFNNNQINCILINQTAATGVSAHAKPTQLVPANKVKQRCMVILQAELDVNLEVQKRGRIFRTGQIMPPIYDYVISAVPAEKRLMMMLQKKLKSLNANTSANQKDADKTVISDDFLNKYGDMIVHNFLEFNPTMNRQLGDPLNIYSEQPITANAAQKVSGRVAILPVKEQSSFYDSVTEQYQTEIKYLDEVGQNDLIVKDMNLDAVTLEKTVAIAGQVIPKSVFGRHSYLEKCEVNNLRKPMTKKELETYLKNTLDGRKALKITEELIAKYETFVEQFRDNDISLEDDIFNLKKEKMLALPKWSEMSNEERIKQQAELEQELVDEKNQRIETVKETWTDRRTRILKVFNFFIIGKPYPYPVESISIGSKSYSKAVFLGFQFDDTKKNPYAPSAINVRFAISDSRRYVALPLSKSEIINQIMDTFNHNRYTFSSDMDEILEEWNDIIGDSQKQRTIRYIVTGNILQAFGKKEFENGYLVSYTLQNGGTKKGILLSEAFNPDAEGERAVRIRIPILSAIPVLMKMGHGSSIYTTDGLEIERQLDKWSGVDSFLIKAPLNKKLGGKFYLDEGILKMISGNNFNKRNTYMQGVVMTDKIQEFVEYLNTNFKSNIEMDRAAFENYLGEEMKVVDYDDEISTGDTSDFISQLKSVKNQRDEEQKAIAQELIFAQEQESLSKVAAEAEKDQKKAEAELIRAAKANAANQKLLHLQALLLEEVMVEMRKGGVVKFGNGGYVMSCGCDN